MIAEAAESASDGSASSVDDGRAPIYRTADDRPLVYDLSTAEVVQEALAALRRDRVEPLDDALLPGMQLTHDWRVLDDQPVHSNRTGQHRRRRQRPQVPRAWLVAGACAVAAVGIALATVTVINQQDPDGRQPGGQIEVTAEADVSGRLAPDGGPPSAGPTDLATAGSDVAAGPGSAAATGPGSATGPGLATAGPGVATAGLGSAPANPAPFVGTPVIPTVAAQSVGTPAAGNQQPAVISSLAAGDPGFGWPSSAFGTAGG